MKLQLKFALMGGSLWLAAMCAAQTAATATPATPAVASASQAPATPAAATPPPPPPLVWSGAFDIYYGYNFNKPPTTRAGQSVTGPGFRNFDYKDEMFALGLAELGLSRATSDTSRFGFTIKLAYGPTEDLLTSPGDVDNKNVLQAYGTYLLPGKRPVTVDAGKFVTHMGLEVIEPSGNWNFSRSLLFQYFIPYYHAGVRAGVPLSDKVTATGYIYNGWNNVSFDTNHNKAYGAELAYAPNASTTWTFNGLTSVEPAGLQDQPKTTVEAIWAKTINPAWSSAVDLNYDWGQGTLASAPQVPNSDWNGYGVAAYLKYSFKGGSSLSLRGEYARDKDGFLFGIGNAIAKEATLTYSLKNALFTNSEIRIEYRYDTATQPGLFTGNSATHQNTLTLSHIFTF